MLALFRWISRCPLRLLHGAGFVAGWITWLASPTWRRRFAENSRVAGFSFAEVRPAVGHVGRMLFETPRLWFGKPVPVDWVGCKPAFDAAYATGRGVVFMTPHLGCFEIAAQVVGANYGKHHGPITVLYRPARKAWLAPVVEAARAREGLQTAPATLAGVRELMRALHAGQAVGLLPDQVPPQGQGVWAPFFGKPAYSMTLAARLIQKSGAVPVLVWGERLPRGRGFRLHATTMGSALAGDLETAVAQINRAMEDLIRQCPGQYLWGYGRYKTPRIPEGHA